MSKGREPLTVTSVGVAGGVTVCDECVGDDRSQLVDDSQPDIGEMSVRLLAVVFGLSPASIEML